MTTIDPEVEILDGLQRKLTQLTEMVGRLELRQLASEPAREPSKPALRVIVGGGEPASGQLPLVGGVR